MNKILLLLFIITFSLIGCSSQDDENNDLDILKIETLQTFTNIDFSEFSVVGVEKLDYYNSYQDFEYIVLTNYNSVLKENIVNISNDFSIYDYSYGGLLQIIVGEEPELKIYLENETDSIEVRFYRGYNEGDAYRSVLFIYVNDEDAITSIGFYNAFQTEIQSIFDLLN